MRAWLKYVGITALMVLGLSIVVFVPVFVIENIEPVWAEVTVILVWMSIVSGTAVWFIER